MSLSELLGFEKANDVYFIVTLVLMVVSIFVAAEAILSQSAEAFVVGEVLGLTSYYVFYLWTQDLG